jgi:hypothetical protein
VNILEPYSGSLLEFFCNNNTTLSVALNAVAFPLYSQYGRFPHVYKSNLQNHFSMVIRNKKDAGEML